MFKKHLFTARKISRGGGVVSTVLLLWFSVLSCEIGLGPSVDTEPPTLSIVDPVANNIIRDKFTMSGAWDDDGEIGSLVVTLFNTDTKKDFKGFVTEIDKENKTWSCTIDPNESYELAGGSGAKERLFDGSYEATISIKDTYAHETKASVAFRIDNTPPLVILTRPATKMDAVNADSYGCIFSLEGEAVDDNTISMVEVEVYDITTNELKTVVQLQNVAKKIDRSVATFGGIEYEQIFGEVPKDANGNYILDNINPKNFYCKVIAYDDARKVPAVEGDKGNATSEFYLLSEISKYITEYKSIGFYQIMNGTYYDAGESSARYSVSEIKQVIENSKLGAASFSLDPRNNPRYTVSGRSNIGELKSYMTSESKTNVLVQDAAKLNNNSVTEISLYAGLDNYYINRDTVGIYVQECDASGNIISNAPKFVLFPKYKNKDGSVNTDDIGGAEWTAEAVAERESQFKISGSTYSVNATIGTKKFPNISVGSYYKFVVDGYDEGGNAIHNYGDTDYAFKLASVNSTPSLTITKLERSSGTQCDSMTSVDLLDGETLKIYGTAALEDLSPDVEFSYGVGTEFTDPFAKMTAAEFATNGYTCVIPASYKNTTFTIHIVAVNPEEPDQAVSKDITVTYDCEGPVIGDVTINPVVIENNVEYVNGTVTLKSSVEDAMNTVSKVEYTVTAKGVESARQTVEKISATGFKIDTTKYDDNSKISVNIYATDKPGNVSQKSFQLNINQSTDLPVIEFNNADRTIKDKETIKNRSAAGATNNIFGIQANNRIQASISDDDGIKTVKIIKRDTSKASNDPTATTTEVLVENGTSTNYTLNNVMAKAQCELEVYVIVEDTKGEKTGYNTLTTEKFLVAVDEGAPNFSITSENNALQAQNQDIRVAGVVSDGTPVVIKRYEYKKANTITGASFDANERYFIEVAGGKYVEKTDPVEADFGTYLVRVEDEYSYEEVDDGNGGKVKQSTIKIDTPTWSDKIPAAEVGTTGKTLYYEATDDYGQTTGQTYVYTIDFYPPKFTVSRAGDTFTDSTNTSGLTTNLTGDSRKKVFVKPEEGTYLTIEGRAYDCDETGTESTDEKKTRGLGQYVYYRITDATVEPNADDEYNINEVDSSNKALWYNTNPIKSGGSWTHSIHLNDSIADGSTLEDGKPYTLYLAVRDAAGNLSKASKNPSSAVLIIPDKTKPTVTLKSVTLGGTDITSEQAVVLTAADQTNNSAIVYTVTITDPGANPSGIKSVQISESSTLNLVQAGTSNDYTFTLNAKDFTTGTYNYTVRATDNVGLSGDLALKPITVDFDAPTVSVGEFSPSVTDSAGNMCYNGIISIQAYVSDNTNLSEISWEIVDSSGNVVTTDQDGKDIVAADVFVIPATETKVKCETTSLKATWSNKVEPGQAKTIVTTKNPVITIETDKLSSGDATPTYKLRIYAMDEAGNKYKDGSVEYIEKSFTVNQPTDKPVITLTNANSAIKDLDGMKAAEKAGLTSNIFGTSSNHNLQFSVTDDDGITSVTVKCNGSAIYTYDGSADSNPKQKSFNISDLPTAKGEYTVEIIVVDKAGESKTYSSDTTGEFKVAIDDEEPKITELKTIAVAEVSAVENKKKDGIYYVNDEFYITITASDDYKLDKLTHSAGADISFTQSSDPQTKQIHVEKETSSTEVTKKITVYDIFGRYTERDFKYVFDLGKPTVAISGSNLKNTNYMNARSTFSVNGTSSDGSGATSSGVTEIQFAIVKDKVTEYPAAGSPNIIVDFSSDGVSGGTEDWVARLDAGTITEEGEYTFFVKAIDFAGNESDLKTLSFIADTKVPETTINEHRDAYGLESTSTGAVISGILTETHFDKMTVTVKKTGESTSSTIAPTTTPGTAGGAWAFNLPIATDHKKDGEYTITMEFEDKVGNKLKPDAIIIKIDTTPPTVSIAECAACLGTGKVPDPSSTTGAQLDCPTCSGMGEDSALYANNSVEFKGTSSDGEHGVGVSKVYYLISDAATGVTTATSGWQEVTGTTAWNFYGKFKQNGVQSSDSTAKGEGQYYLYVYAVDNAQNKSNISSRPFKVDFAAPTVNSVKLAKGTKTAENLTVGELVYANLKDTKDNSTNTITLSGTVADTCDIKKIELTATKGSDTRTYTLAEPTSPATSPKDWSKTFTVNVSDNDLNNAKLADGEWMFTVKVTDWAGRETPASYRIHIDTVKPVFDEDKLKVSDEEWNANNWYKTTTLKIEGLYTESGSGVNRVDYTVGTLDSKYVLADSDNKFVATIDTFTSNAKNVLKLKAIDKAGNESEEEAINISIDMVGPAISDTKIKRGDGLEEEVNSTKPVLVNKDKNITISVSAIDALSSVDKVYFAFGEQNFTPSNAGNIKEATNVSGTNWAYEIPKADLKSGTIYVKAVDKAGNEKDAQMMSFNVDEEPPTVSFSSHTTGSTVNKEITLRGTVLDNQEVESVKFKILDATGENATKEDKDKPVLLAETTLTPSGSNWTYTLDTNSTTYNDKNIKIVLTAVDKAGNTSSATEDAANGHIPSITLHVDQNTDRPIIKLTNLSATTGAITQNKNVTVLVSDDDGLSGLVLKMATGDSAPTSWDSVSAVSLNSGSGSFDVGGEGLKKLWFYVKDAKNGVFVTNTSASTVAQKYAVPYIEYDDADGKTHKVDNNSTISYTYDNTAPVIELITYGFGPKAGTTATDAEKAAVKTSAKSSLSATTFPGDNYDMIAEKCTTCSGTGKDGGGNCAACGGKGLIANSSVEKIIFGGKKKAIVTLAVKVTDANGVKSVVAKGKGISGNLVEDRTTPYWYLEDVELLREDNITITVTDNGGMTKSSDAYTYTIDNIAPVFTFTRQDKTVSPMTLTGTINETNEIVVFDYLVLNDAYYSASGEVNITAVNNAFLNKTYPTAYPSGSEATTSDFAIPEVKSLIPSGSTKFSGTSWSVTLDGNDLPGDGTKLGSMKFVPTVAQDVYNVRVYFRAVDNLGNEHFKYETITYDPYGTRPKAEVTYPTGTMTDPMGMNGSIRISGTSKQGEADGATAPKVVYVQFDLNKDGNFDADDLTLLKGYKDKSNNLLYTGSAANAVIEGTDAVKTAQSFEAINTEALGTETAFWGLPVLGTLNSWYRTINQYMEFQNDSTANDSEKTIFLVGARAIAIATDGTFGPWSDPQYIKIDTNVPQFGNVPTIVEKDSSDAEVSRRAYQQDMYLKGKTEIVVDIFDATDIAKVLVYEASRKEDLNKSSTTITTYTVGSSTELTPITDTSKFPEGVPTTGKGYTLTHVLSEGTESGSKYIKVQAYKGNENSSYEIYNVNFDNTAPTIDTFALNSVVYADSDKKIVNSNGVFTLGGKMTDEHSGYDRVGFYFIRGEDKDQYNTRIYDPVKYPTYEITLATSNGTTKPAIADNRKMTVGEKTMYGVTKTVSVTTANDVSTLTLDAADTNIKAGGLVYLGGTFLRIQSVSGTTVTLSTVTTVSGTGKTAFFPYLWIVDNTGAEKTDLDGLSFTTDAQKESDDGDGMPESIIKNNRTWAWDATFQSMYIPDGPGKVVIFAWDKAGNVSASEYDVSVQNNAPRLVKLHLGTDLNGSGDSTGATAYYDDNEFVSYDVLNEVGKQTAYSAMQTKRYTGKSFRVKNKLAVVPEFVGGNFTASDANGIMMIANAAAESEATATINGNDKIGTANYYKVDSTKAKFAASSKILSGVGKTYIDVLEDDSTSEKYGKIKNIEVDNNIWLFELTNDQLGSQSSDKGENAVGDRAFSFTFWDKTADTTQGVDSSYCYLRITDLIIDTVDTSAPEAKITPFYWNSKEDSSVPLDDSAMPLGHIDLEEDIGKTNPGVSGQVYVRGTAWDNTRLYAIYIKTPDAKSYKIAEYKDGNWIVAKRVGTGIKYYKYTETDGETEITTDAPTWATTSYAAWDSNIKGCTIEKDYGVTQDGHKAEWCLEIDMTPYGVAKNNNVIAYAEDAAKKDDGTDNHQTSSSTAAAQTKTSALTSTYIMDFVPYIKSVESVAGANYTVRRSRLGRYPVRAGAKIRINGMNFAKDANYSVAFYKTNTTTGKQAETANSWTAPTGGGWSGKIPGDGYIEITAPDYSCFVEVTVAGEKTQNNINKNDVGYNIQKGSYRGKGTSFKGDLVPGDDFWTDDCYLSVWNVAADTLFPGSVNPHSGVIKKVDTRNSGSGAPSDAGSKNPSAAAGPGGGYLYKQPEGKSQVDPITGMNDSYYAAISSDDLKLYGYVSGNTYASHGDNIAYNSSEVAYMCPVDEMDYTIVNGMPYYVLQDNGLGGDSGSVWGMGLAMMREGIWYDRQYCSPIKGNTMEEEKLPFYVERQGYKIASHKRNSSSGYDSVLYQFKNPRIAGWYNSADSLLYQTKDGGGTVTGVDYIYISYFDSYAKCLKYAAYRVGHRFASNDHKYSNTALKDWGKNDVDHDIDIVVEMSSSPILITQTFDDKGNVTYGNTLTSNQPAQKAFNHMKDGKSVVAGEDTTSSNPSPTTVAGEWSDILVDPVDHMPIIVYYNMTAKSLEIARGSTAFPQSTSAWNKTLGIRPEGATDFGRYVSAAIDTSGNLHVAAQDADTAKLYYLYLTKNGTGYTVANSVAVDGSSGAGRWTDIELTDPSKTTIAEIKPVISYINTGFLGTTSGVKVAYLESEEGTGSNAKLHFEAMTDPAQYTAGDQRTSVMADVKETKAGSIKAPVAVGFNSDKLALDFLRGEE